MIRRIRTALSLPFFIGCVINAQVAARLLGLSPDKNRLPAHVTRLTRRKTATVYKFATDPQNSIVKIIYRRKARDYLRFLDERHADREHKSALALAEIGLRVPEPRGSFSNWNPFSKVDSIYVAEFMEGFQPGKIFLRPDLTAPEIRRVFIRKYAAGMRLMLDSGLHNLDAHPGNVMWNGDPDEELVWIDNDVETFPPEGRPAARQSILDLLEWKVRRDESGLTLDEVEEISRMI